MATEWSTITISVPKEMVYVDKKSGRVSLLVDPLTKKGDIAKKGGEPSVILKTDPHIDAPQILNEGVQINTHTAKQLGQKYKGQIKEAKGNKTDMLGELKREAGKVRTRAIVPVNGERAIVPVVSDRALIPLNREERSIVPVAQKPRRPRLQPVDVDDGGLDGWADDLNKAATNKTTVRPLDDMLRGAMNRLDADLRVSSRRYTAFEELRNVGQAAMSRIPEDSGLEEHKSPESHEMLRQRQEGRRATAFGQLQEIGKKALKKQSNAENYAANRGRIRQHRNEKIECECGDMITRTNQARHLKSKRHTDNMARR